MAGLSAGPRGRGRDRGQLLLVAGFALAVLLLALAVALNGATYSGNLATRDDGGDTRDAARFQYGVERQVGDLIRATNAQRPNEDDYTERKALFRENLGNWSTFADRHAAEDATAVNVSLVKTTKGTRVLQENDSRTLTDADGNATWTVANGVNATRDFRMTLDRGSLSNDSCIDWSCFTVEVRSTDSNETWRMGVSRDDENVTVHVDGPSSSGTCSVRANETTVDLTAGTLGGAPCAPLDFGANVTGPYDVVFVNGDRATGRYALVVDESIASDSFGSTGSPRSHAVVWSATVEVTYRTPDLDYSREIRVVPGDVDA